MSGMTERSDTTLTEHSHGVLRDRTESEGYRFLDFGERPSQRGFALCVTCRTTHETPDQVPGPGLE